MTSNIFRPGISILAVALVIISYSCDVSKKFEREERQKISNYLSDNSTLQFVKKPSGLYFLDVLAGSGLSPVRTDSAYVWYTGKFLDGRVFDTNVGSGTLYKFIVGQNITGFDEGLTYMKAGGKATFLIPSSLGYGAAGSYSGYSYISGYTPLLFDVQLVKVIRAAR
jgi:FKBP-type peptidyl-prolyl cis-trans isomerase